MLEDNAKIWKDGQIIKAADAKVSLLTHSLHYGSAVFEGIRAYSTNDGTAVFRLREHIERLVYSANALYMNVPYTVDELVDACKKIVRENNLDSAYIRPLIYYGDENMGLNPSNNNVYVSIIAWEWGAYLPGDVDVKISSIKRISEQTTTVDAKISGHYTNSIMATLEAKNMGYDEALLLDHNENIAEGPGENIFFINQNTIYTPSLGAILEGITRDSIIEVARDMGYNVVERNISPWELNSFEEAFFTGTAAEIAPIKSIGEYKYATEKSKEIREKFMQIVCGNNSKFNKWLDYV